MKDILDRIIFKDQLVIILNKPPGIPVHAGPNGGDNLEDYFVHLRFDYKETPHLAHRLDRDTSGCLVLGRNERSLRKLGKLFESHRIKKTYWAIVMGKMPQAEGTIDVSLKKVKQPKGWTMRPAPRDDVEAQNAITDYKVLKELRGNMTLVELYPRTGRTHQLRVHLKSIGCPIKGDWLYSGPDTRPPEGEFPTLHLHARSIEIPLYEDKPVISVTAEPPDHMAKLIN